MNRLGNRIIILGCPGSGKSTLSKQLHELLELPLFHLDNIWWKKDRTHISREEFDEELGKIVQGDRWIIDGDYSRTYKTRFRYCDTVIFLDYDEDECMKGIKERIGKTRDDIPWKEEKLDPELVKQVRNYRKKSRRKIFELIEKYKERQILIFKSREQLEEWISDLQEISSDQRCST